VSWSTTGTSRVTTAGERVVLGERMVDGVFRGEAVRRMTGSGRCRGEAVFRAGDPTGDAVRQTGEIARRLLEGGGAAASREGGGLGVKGRCGGACAGVVEKATSGRS
jgi:hypothetical protein